MASSSYAPELEDDGDQEALKWDPALRRRIRTEQRRIINEVHNHREDMTLPDQLVKQVDKLDQLMDNVVASKEAAIDAEGFRLLSAIGREQVEQTHGSLIQFDTVTYAEKLVTYMGGRRGVASGRIGQLDWAQLGDRAARAFKRAPAANFVYGALECAPVKKRAARGPGKKLGKEAMAKGATLKEVHDLKEEEESTTKDVQHIMKHAFRGCREKGRLGYFQFLVDPQSFARTVENMFHFAFLVKDGRMGVTLGQDGVPYIYLPSQTDESGQSIRTTKNQTIVSLTIAEWQRAIDKFHITRASIPPRQQ